MPSLTLKDGTNMQYGLHGSGPTVVLTPGGRSGMEFLLEFPSRHVSVKSASA